jgi:hypothetical protein
MKNPRSSPGGVSISGEDRGCARLKRSLLGFDLATNSSSNSNLMRLLFKRTTSLFGTKHQSSVRPRVENVYGGWPAGGEPS